MQRFWAWPLILGAVALFETAPEAAQATCALPNQLTNGQTADASQVMANFNSVLGCVNGAPAGSTNALQYNAGNGTFGAVGPLTNGQIPIGSTGNAPSAAQLTAGTGITITNGAGTVTISGAATPYTPPKLANFTWGNQPSGATATDTNTGLSLYTPENGGGENETVLWDAGTYPSSPFTFVVGFDATQLAVGSPIGGVVVGDGSGKFIRYGMYNNGGEDIQVVYFTNYTTPSSTAFTISANNIRFLAIEDSGSNLTFFVGANLNAMVQIYQASRTAWLSAPSKLGLVVNSGNSSYGTSATYFDYAK